MHTDLSRAALAAAACSQALQALEQLRDLRAELDGPGIIEPELASSLQWLQNERGQWMSWVAEYEQTCALGLG